MVLGTAASTTMRRLATIPITTPIKTTTNRRVLLSSSTTTVRTLVTTTNQTTPTTTTRNPPRFLRHASWTVLSKSIKAVPTSPGTTIRRSYTVPIVLESGSLGERSFDIFSRLLRERIVCVHGQVTDTMASLVTAQLLFLEAEHPTKPVYMYINSPGGVVRIVQTNNQNKMEKQ